MASLAVVKAFDIFLYCGFRVGPGGVTLMVDQFVFQTAPEAFHGRVVIAVPRRDMDGFMPNCVTSF